MTGLTLGPLVRALLLFTLINLLVVLETSLVALTITLVVSVVWGLEFLSQQKLSQLVTLFCFLCLRQNNYSLKVVDSLNYFGAKDTDFSS